MRGADGQDELFGEPQGGWGGCEVGGGLSRVRGESTWGPGSRQGGREGAGGRLTAKGSPWPSAHTQEAARSPHTSSRITQQRLLPGHPEQPGPLRASSPV